MKSIFRPLEAREIIIPVGLDLGEIHEQEASAIRINRSMRVRVNGIPCIDPTVIPGERSLVEFIAIPQFGIEAAILAATITIVETGSITAGVFSAIGSLLLTNLPIILSVALSMIFKPQTPSLTPENPTISGSRNTSDPQGPMHRHYGRNRIHPTMASAPFTINRGPEEYLALLLDCGYGPWIIDMSTAQIGETPLTEYELVEYDIRHGFDNDVPLTLFPSVVDTIAVGKTLADQGGYSTGFQVTNTSTVTARCILGMLFPGGLYDPAKKIGMLVYFNVDVEDLNPDPGDPSVWIPFLKVEEPITRQQGIPALGIRETYSLRYRATSSFTLGMEIDFNQPNNPKYNPADPSATVGEYAVSFKAIPQVPHSSKSLKIIWDSLKIIRDEEPFENDSKPTAKIVLIVKATDQLNGLIDTFSVIGEAVVPYFDPALGPDGEWVEVPQPTAHPALENDPTFDQWAAFRTHRASWAAADVMRSGNLVESEFITDDIIDAHRLYELQVHDENQATRPVNPVPGGYTFHGSIRERKNLHTTLNDIYATSSAQFLIRDTKYSLIIDQDRSDVGTFPPLGVISPVACSNFSYSGNIDFPRIPHAVRFTWRDPTSDNYIVATDTVYRDGYSEDGAGMTEVATRIDDVDLWGVMNHGQGVDYVKHLIGQLEWRSQTHTVLVPAEHLSWEAGDLLLLSYDISGVGEGSGRIVGLRDAAGIPITDPDIDTIRFIDVDNEVTYTEFDSLGAPKNYGIDWMGEDTVGNHAVPNQAPPNLTTTTILLSPDITGPVRPYLGNRFNFGELNFVSKRVLVKSKSPNAEYGSELVLHDAADEIFADMLTNRPSYDPAKSIPTQKTPPIPRVISIESGLGFIRVSVTSGDGNITTSFVEARYRVGEQDQPWSAPIKSNASGTVVFHLSPVSSGFAYGIQIRAVGNASNRSSWTPETFFTYEPAENPEIQITGLEWVGLGNSTELTGNDFESEWRLSIPGVAEETLSNQFQLDQEFNDMVAATVSGYKVRVRESITGSLLREVEVKDRFYNYNYAANIRDGGPYRNITHEVAAIRGSAVGNFFALSGSNSAPSLPLLIEASALSTAISIELGGDYSLNPDYTKIFVFAKIDDGSDLDLIQDNVVYEGSSNTMSFPTIPGTTYRVRWCASDSFSRSFADLNVSADGYRILTIAEGSSANRVVDGGFELTAKQIQNIEGDTPQTTYTEAQILSAGFYTFSTNASTNKFSLQIDGVEAGAAPYAGDYMLRLETLAADPLRWFLSSPMRCYPGMKMGVRVRHQQGTTPGDDLKWRFTYTTYKEDMTVLATNNGALQTDEPFIFVWFEKTDEFVLPTLATTYYVSVGIRFVGSADGVKHYFDNLEMSVQIPTTYIEDAAINNAKIANLAVDTAKVSELDAVKLTAGSIKTDKISAGEIRADRLIIGARDNLIDDPGFETKLVGEWNSTSGGGTWAINSTSVRTGAQSLEYDCSGQSSAASISTNNSDHTLGANGGSPAGQTLAWQDHEFDFLFYAAWTVADPVTDVVKGVIEFRKFNGDIVSTVTSTLAADLGGVADTWVPVRVNANAPALASYAVFYIKVEDGATDTSKLHFDTLSASRKADQFLLQIGSATTVYEYDVTTTLNTKLSRTDITAIPNWGDNATGGGDHDFTTIGVLADVLIEEGGATLNVRFDIIGDWSVETSYVNQKDAVIIDAVRIKVSAGRGAFFIREYETISKFVNEDGTTDLLGWDFLPGIDSFWDAAETDIPIGAFYASIPLPREWGFGEGVKDISVYCLLHHAWHPDYVQSGNVVIRQFSIKNRAFDLMNYIR